MRVINKKFLGLILISGLLLTALLHVWNPWSGSVVDIQPRQQSTMKNLIERTTQLLVSSYEDIAYHIKEDVAR